MPQRIGLCSPAIFKLTHYPEIQRLNEELEQGVVERTSQLMQASEALREAQRELAHVNRVTTMGQLAASIAHEAMQPISAGVTNAQAALHWLDAQPPDPEEVRQALGRVVNEGRRASAVIGRIRALVNKAPPCKDSFDINEAILEVIALTGGELVKNGVSVQTQLTQGLALIQGDRVQLQQVILNLMIGTRTDAWGGVLVTVKDSGAGLKSEGYEHVFDAFYTTKPGGIGIGLSICRSIVEAHGGAHMG